MFVKQTIVKRLLFPLCAAFAMMLAVPGANAQTAREEINANPALAASNHLAYITPTKKLSPAPKGYTPFYISHYGRHGSRWLIEPEQYLGPVETLRKADSLGVLTTYGKDVLSRLEKVSEAAVGRYGELTPLGHRQHRGIAERMYSNFQPVFKGKTRVEARSSTVIRCILSMTSETQRLAELNPQLDIHTDASEGDMKYINNPDNWRPRAYSFRAGGMNETQKFNRNHIHPERLMGALFTNPSYLDRRKATSFMDDLWAVATNQQSLDMDFDFEDLFTIDEKYDLWQCQNVKWYNEFGPSKLTKEMMPYFQAPLLQNILDTADSCIVSKNNNVSLRFGHEVVILPLACLMELGNSGALVDDMEDLDENWKNYEIYPMGANIQLIFYRSKKANQPVLVKALLNEKEVTLPVETNMFPYYSWDKVEGYYRGKLANYEKYLKNIETPNNR